jgi:hypothetical protein
MEYEYYSRKEMTVVKIQMKEISTIIQIRLIKQTNYHLTIL